MQTRIGLVTTDLSQFNYDDPDGEDLAFALESLGWVVDQPIWSEGAVVWEDYDALILRSLWDYAADPQALEAWLDEVSEVTRLFNPADLVRWNADKTYLLQLADLGVAIPDTDFCSTEEQVRQALSKRSQSPSGLVVVKPNISAGSRLTGLFDVSETPGEGGAGEPLGPPLALARQILGEGKKVMVQDAVTTVSEGAERGLVYFDGVYSHCFRKGAILEVGGGLVGGEYDEGIGEATPTTAEREFADQVMRALGQVATDLLWESDAQPPVYARIDVATDQDGTVKLMEAELFEPSLYFNTADPQAPMRLAEAVSRRLRA